MSRRRHLSSSSDSDSGHKHRSRTLEDKDQRLDHSNTTLSRRKHSSGRAKVPKYSRSSQQDSTGDKSKRRRSSRDNSSSSYRNELDIEIHITNENHSSRSYRSEKRHYKEKSNRTDNQSGYKASSSARKAPRGSTSATEEYDLRLAEVKKAIEKNFDVSIDKIVKEILDTKSSTEIKDLLEVDITAKCNTNNVSAAPLPHKEANVYRDFETCINCKHPFDLNTSPGSCEQCKKPRDIDSYNIQNRKKQASVQPSTLYVPPPSMSYYPTYPQMPVPLMYYPAPIYTAPTIPYQAAPPPVPPRYPAYQNSNFNTSHQPHYNPQASYQQSNMKSSVTVRQTYGHITGRMPERMKTKKLSYRFPETSKPHNKVPVKHELRSDKPTVRSASTPSTVTAVNEHSKNDVNAKPTMPVKRSHNRLDKFGDPPPGPSVLSVKKMQSDVIKSNAGKKSVHQRLGIVLKKSVIPINSNQKKKFDSQSFDYVDPYQKEEAVVCDWNPYTHYTKGPPVQRPPFSRLDRGPFSSGPWSQCPRPSGPRPRPSGSHSTASHLPVPSPSSVNKESKNTGNGKPTTTPIVKKDDVSAQSLSGTKFTVSSVGISSPLAASLKEPGDCSQPTSSVSVPNDSNVNKQSKNNDTPSYCPPSASALLKTLVLPKRYG